MAEVTDAGLSCDQARPVMGFEVRDCGRDSGGSRAFVGVYARANGDLAGVDMTLVSANPTDPDTLVSFVALGLGGAMGPDTFDAVSEQVSSRLDGSSPNPVWVSADLRLTVRVSGNSTFVTVLAADLAAAWGS